MLIYGSKLYIVVSGSSNIRVLDLATKQDLKTIPMFDDGEPCMPRYLAAHGGKIYATCYNGDEGIVAKIDTAQLVWEAQTRVGVRPEGIAVNSGKLYVANSGILFVYDNTLSVVDIATFKELKKITVGTNPNIVRADGNYIYLSYQGDWSGIPGGFQRIDVRDEKVVTVNDSPTMDFAIVNGSIYYYNVSYNEDWTTAVSFGKMQVAANGSPTISPLLTGSVTIAAPFCIGVHPEAGEIYIGDAGDYVNPGSVFVFDSQGKQKNEFTVGISPCKFAFY
jgi:YVTN family beta-propeller protein